MSLAKPLIVKRSPQDEIFCVFYMFFMDILTRGNILIYYIRVITYRYYIPLLHHIFKFMEVHDSCISSIMNLFLLHKSTSKKNSPFLIDYVGIEYDQPPQDPLHYCVSIITGSYSGLERGGSFVESLDGSMQENLGNPIPDRTVRDHICKII